MNVETVPTTVIDVKLTLTEAEARAFLVVAEPLQAAVRKALGVLTAERNPTGRSKTGGKAISFRPKLNAAPKASAPKGRGGGGECPICHKTYSNLALHQRKARHNAPATAPGA